MGAEHQTVEGVCENVETRNGWNAYSIRADNGSLIKLATKKPEIIKAAVVIGAARAVWTYSSQTTEKDGRTYTNHYLEAVAATEQPRKYQAVPDERRQELIVRQSCLKAAVDSLAEGTAAPVITAQADHFVAWVWEETAPVADEPGDIPFYGDGAGVRHRRRSLPRRRVGGPLRRGGGARARATRAPHRLETGAAHIETRCRATSNPV